MPQRFPPRSDKAAVDCLRQFAQGIAASPYVYGASPADVETINAVVGEFVEAYERASNRATRSFLNVAAKDVARAQAEKLCQGYRNRIRHNYGIDDVSKLAIHVTPVNRSRTKVFVQKSLPVLTVLGATQGEHHLRYADSVTPTRIAKPYGAMFLELIVSAESARASSRANAKTVGIFSRNAITVRFDHADNGKTATYWGRWCGKHTADVGPWSMPVSMTIAA